MLSMAFFLALPLFLFGLIVGSFLNVLIYRFNTGQTITGRSRCFSCNKKLKPKHLIPVFSFLIQKGKCAHCGSGIAWQYPAVELATGLLFVLAGYLATSVFSFVWFSFIFSILLVITVYDLRHKIIPDFYVYLFIATTLIYQIYLWWAGIGTFSDFIIGPCVALFFASLWFVSKGRWMGFGDAKLVLGIGFFLGFPEALWAVLLAFWIGGFVGIVLLLGRARGATMKSELPFAPFLVLGTLLSFFANTHFLENFSF